MVDAVLVASALFIKAQPTGSGYQAAQSVAATSDDLAVMLQALEQVPPLPPQDSPVGGNFYTVQHGQDWPPLPGNVLNLPFWSLGDNFFVLDDRNVDYAELQAEAEAAAALAEAAAPMMRMSMMSSLSSSYAYGNPVYLTNMAAVIAYDGSTTASFSIAGGTNFVPYDILMTTNLLSPIDWTWLGIGYTSNNYTFYSQSPDNAFYRLAKPFHTQIIGLGDDTHLQCDVPPGITNAVQVAGGYAQGLALLNDGTVQSWGDNYFTSQPTNLTGVTMIACGWNHNVALLDNGTVLAWGMNAASLGWHLTEVPTNLTNVVVISAQGLHTLALKSDGTVTAWGYNGGGETNVPTGLTNVTAIAAGGQFNLAVSNGCVVAWGFNNYGQCTVPTNLNNAVDVAAGWNHSVALKADGTMVCWGDNHAGQCDVPAGLSNVVAIAAGGFGNAGDYTLALQNDGTMLIWGGGKPVAGIRSLDQVVGIAGGANHALALRTGTRAPVITLPPVDQYQIAGSNVTFTAKGQGLYGVSYQWQGNGVNISGATNATLTVTNVQTTSATNYAVLVTDNGGMGSVVSDTAYLNVITPPVITYQSTPTNIVCLYGNFVSLAATASAPGQTNGFPLSYQWKYNGTNISRATGNAYGFPAVNPTGTYSLVVANAAGSVSASWQVANTNAINVTNDLLLVYNTNSADSKTVLDYYLAHRPGVSGANVLGIGCTNSEAISSVNFSNQVLAPYLNWLTNNPAKHPQYLVLFLDIPSRVNDTAEYPSVQYQLHTETPGGQPFVTSINMNGTNDCIGYINKLATFGTNGQLAISASAGGYGNTNYVVDNVRDNSYEFNGGVVSAATNGLIAAGVPANNILYLDGLESLYSLPPLYLPHLTNAPNVAGYISWGAHSSLGVGYAATGLVRVQWSGNSSWWIIRTEESHNGDRISDQGNFLDWFSSNAFGGTSYSNTPVGAVSYVWEPTAYATDNAIYFGLWAGGKNLAICAWNSTGSSLYIQTVGDPFVTR